MKKTIPLIYAILSALFAITSTVAMYEKDVDHGIYFLILAIWLHKLSDEKK